MNDPDAQLRALFERADHAFRPTEEDLARLDARTLPLVNGPHPPPRGGSGRRAARLGGAGLGVVLLAAFGVSQLTSPQPHQGPSVVAPPPPPHVVAESPSVAATNAEATSAEEEMRPVSVDSLPAVTGARTSPAAPAGSPRRDQPAGPSSLEEEVRLIRGATDRRRAGDAEGALALLEEHAHRFPAGVLADQRDVERIVALCDEGAVAPAEDHARAFFSARPTSPLAVRVRASCAGHVEEERR